MAWNVRVNARGPALVRRRLSNSRNLRFFSAGVMYSTPPHFRDTPLHHLHLSRDYWNLRVNALVAAGWSPLWLAEMEEEKDDDDEA